MRRSKSEWAGEVDGHAVEAGVHLGALDREGREQLVRYCLRPAIANERLPILEDGSIAYLCNCRDPRKVASGGAAHGTDGQVGRDRCTAALSAVALPRRAGSGSPDGGGPMFDKMTVVKRK